MLRKVQCVASLVVQRTLVVDDVICQDREDLAPVHVPHLIHCACFSSFCMSALSDSSFLICKHLQPGNTATAVLLAALMHGIHWYYHSLLESAL
jgi:hypothetical protein